jgi:PhoPQ-activated pathogenicity-related protein
MPIARVCPLVGLRQVEMKHAKIALSVVLLLVVVLLVAAAVSADSSKVKLSLKASPTKCKVGKSVKFTVTVTSKTAPYEVRLYKSTGGSWSKVTTASKVAAGQYVAYAKASPKGTLRFKAGFVNSQGSVITYSNSVSVKATK